MHIVTCCPESPGGAGRCATLPATFRASPPVRLTPFRLPLLTLFLILIAGCGYKGPLYLPQDKPAAKKPAPQPAPVAEPSRQP
jgi:predicted small lipoprotein YifL